MSDGSLSLPALLYLVAWDTETGEGSGAAPQARAGALVELARRGLLVDEDDIVTPVDMDALTGDGPLDELLELIRESRPHGWRSWVTLHARETADALREQLTAEGYLRTERKRVLGVFPGVEHKLERAADVAALRAEIQEVLDGPVPVAEVPERDATAAVLAAAAELGTPTPVKDPERVEQLVAHVGTGVPGLRKVIDEVRTALTPVPAEAGE
ncbi:GPP34 family phosphoprotein [Streptomyces sp. NPDC092369]|uniref:GOLPH3/VPS74 family protein n=1 Tax=Streptomyces sp. NPDC092369 TaxID=3366015 RepID=UPI00381659BB